MNCDIVILPHAADLPMPAYATEGAAAFDLRAAIPHTARIVTGGRLLVPVGFKIALPEGYEMQIRPRSGLALHHGVTVLNSPGTVDHDYRGEVCVILRNTGRDSWYVNRGERIAQAVIAPVTRVAFSVVAELGDTERGGGGFGSTGMAA